MLIDLLLNEQIFKIKKLIIIIVDVLLRLTISIPKAESESLSDCFMLMTPLSESSYAVKEHLLKKAHLRKLVYIHKYLK